MTNTVHKTIGRERRHRRVRARVTGTAARPRLCVYKSNRYLHAQIIDDETGKTLASGSTKEAAKGKKTDSAVWLGSELAKRAKKAGIKTIVFDRGGFRFAGRIAALASAARQGGLQF